MSKFLRLCLRALAAGAIGIMTCMAGAAELSLHWPLERTAYQTNEWIDLAVLRSAKQPLEAGTLELVLTGAGGSRLEFKFDVAGAALADGTARRSEHLHLNGWLLRPGQYTIRVAADGATAEDKLEIYSHIRRSEYKLVCWGRARGQQQLIEGEDNLGFNTYYGNPGETNTDNFIRAGVDFFSNCTMGGAHQMDIRSECDWSDPYVARGGTMRVVRRAFWDRTRANVPGVHFYDEPGLTWVKNPRTGEFGPHGVPSQVRAYAAAFGHEPIASDQLDPKNPAQVAAWNHWARWKLGFMDAAWKDAAFGVARVRPDFLSLTQSQYGFSAFTDGYYFNVARSLPITSGHGGYHDFGPGYFNPSYFLEMSRARDHWKPCWYLPTWYGNTTSDQYRLEQNLSFMTGVQGMICPPEIDPFEPERKPAAAAVVETNKLYQWLGPIFHHQGDTKPPVALLYSLSQCIHAQTLDRSKNYASATEHGKNLPVVWLAGQLIQQPLRPIVEEDILDGALANDHKAVVLTSLDYLDPAVIRALEDFATGGGLVLVTPDSTVAIRGAVKLAVAPRMPDQEKIDAIMAAKKYQELEPYTTSGKYIEASLALGRALGEELARRKFEPVLASDVPTIAAYRHEDGDVEYIFATNASYDARTGGRNAIAATSAHLRLPVRGRSVYAPLAPRPESLDASLEFAPGQMRVWALTRRPIGGVRLATPQVRRELVVDEQPIRIELGATVVDTQGGIVSGAIPLRIRLVDALGVPRYDLYRATARGSLVLTLPLAANDPAGTWKVIAQELLSGKESSTSFDYQPPKQAPALAGASPRGVYYHDDKARAFRFARLFNDVTIVAGKSPYTAAAAERLTTILAPWGIRCHSLDVETASKPRSLTEAEAATWCGLNYAGHDQIKSGDKNPPQWAGFNVSGPVILLGNPDDHPIIAYLAKEHYLPYAPDKTKLPGPGRGYFSWQCDAVGRGQESLALVAYDKAGLDEAVGTLYEAVIGMDDLARYAWPAHSSLQAAQTVEGRVPAAAEVAVDSAPAAAASEPALVAKYQKLLGPARLVKFVLPQGNQAAVIYWGGTIELLDANQKPRTRNQFPQDVVAVGWQDQQLRVTLAGGRNVGLSVP